MAYEWSPAHPGCMTSRNEPGTHQTGSWMGPRASPDGFE